MTFNVSNLKTIVEDKILAIDSSTTDMDLLKLAKLADKTQVVRTDLDAEIQTRLTNATASDELLDLLVLSKSSDEVVASSPIKSIQRGVTVAQPGVFVQIPISTINVNKSFLNVTFANGESSSSSKALTVTAAGRLANATTLQLEMGPQISGSTYNRSVIVYWEIVEYV